MVLSHDEKLWVICCVFEFLCLNLAEFFFFSGNLGKGVLVGSISFVGTYFGTS